MRDESPENDRRGSDTWKDWSKVVLHQITELETARDNQRKEISKMQRDIAVLQFKAGMWGALAGLVPVVLYLAYQSMK